MKDLKQLLVEGDPVAREPEMPALEAQAMRQTIVVEARRQPLAAPAWSWPRPFVLGAALAACLAIGISIGLRIGDGVSSVTPRLVAPAAREGGRRQLQMTSPGGTRIIWTFHENLEL